MKQKKNFKRHSFTLIEVVVVIVILVTLASIATPLYLNYVKKANVGAAKTQLKLLEDALTGYKLDMGSYPDGEDGFPGNLSVKVTYTLTNDNAISIAYEATTDKPTVINLTNHCYFCLSGDPTRDVMDEVLYLNADAYTPVDANVAVTGEIAAVENTPFDFRTPTRIGDRINDTTYQQIVNGRGYDHNWLLNTNGDINAVAATLYDPTTGIEMTIHTDQPGVQFYAGNFLDGSFMGKKGVAYPLRSGLCFETQHYPDSPNQPAFPSTTLYPGEKYTTTTIYKFTIN